MGFCTDVFKLLDLKILGVTVTSCTSGRGNHNFHLGCADGTYISAEAPKFPS